MAVPLSGLLALVAMVVGGELYAPTSVGANPAQPGERLLGHLAVDVERAGPSAALDLLAALGMLVFAAVLWDRLRAAQGPQWPAALAGGGAVAAALFMVDLARTNLAAGVAVDAGDAATAGVLITSGWEAARLVLPATAAMMLGTAVAGARGAVPRWFAWLSGAGGLGAVAAMVVLALPAGLAPSIPAGLLAMLGLGWTLPAGAVLAVLAARGPVAATTATTP
ncbi:hypothetical protein [uncultured Cellulomonas sp.]|uniref:hypothetical protein n=1 Tax=uncultured Cellulomonas sp. TaxID=189682 RepID=UPI00260ABBE4|nr:hypothetical protein [uncultured Cellulomonas sp.]